MNIECFKDVLYFLNSTNQEWAWRMLDSFGKVPSGVLKGRFLWLGQFSECNKVIAPAKTGSSIGFKGKYCYLGYSITAQKTMLPLYTGICVPDSCTDSDIGQIFNTIKRMAYQSNLKETNPIGQYVDIKNVNLVDTNCDFDQSPIQFLDYIFLLAMAVLLLLVFFGSYSEWMYKKGLELLNRNIQGNAIWRNTSNVVLNVEETKSENENENDKYKKIAVDLVRCFSIESNTSSLIKASTHHKELSCFHGLRVISMLWVLFGHSTAAFFVLVVNPLDALIEIKKWYFSPLRNATFSVDSFFFSSGFLVAFHFFDTISKMLFFGKKEWLVFYLHRYIRLTASTFLLLVLFMTWWFRGYDGPFSTIPAYLQEQCTQDWWRNFFYLDNLLEEGQSCLGWLWYLDNEWQFFLLSPLVLIGFKKRPELTVMVIGIVISMSVTITFIICYTNSIQTYHYYIENAMLNPEDSYKKILLAYNKLYIKPYCRISPYLIGMCTGYLHFVNGNRRVFISKKKQLMAWSLSLLVLFWCLFITNTTIVSQFEAAVFHAFMRILWTCAYAWITYACVSGYGGFINTFLSANVWYPFSRLSYLVYLFHPLVILSVVSSLEVQTFFSLLNLLFHFIAIAIFTFSAAAVINVLYESPILKIEKYLRSYYM